MGTYFTWNYYLNPAWLVGVNTFEAYSCSAWYGQGQIQKHNFYHEDELHISREKTPLHSTYGLMIMLVRAECVRQRNEVAIILGIIPPSI